MNASHPNGRAGDTELDAAALARLHELDPGGRAGIVTRVLATYEQSLATTLAALHTAEERGDRVELRRLAHTLKSSSASVGALALSACCAEVEALARDDAVAALPPALQRLHAAGSAALGAVRRQLQR